MTEKDFLAAIKRIDSHERVDLHTLRAICERIGYGRVMQATEELWREKDPGGEHTVGPCRVTLDRAGFRDNMDLLLAWEKVPADVQQTARKAAGIKRPARRRKK